MVPEDKSRVSSGRPRWSISQAAASCGATVLGPDGPFPLHISVDSRAVRPGGCFIALEGSRSDGHRFIEDAIAGGARVILAQDGKSPAVAPEGVTLLLTRGNTLDTFLQLAQRYLERVAPSEVIAVTGSVGKTTTREIVAHLLREQGHRLHVAGKSHNTDVGCALTVLSMPEDTDILVLEMGCNHPGEIAEMVKRFPPTRAVITEVGPSHLEGLSTVEGVLAAKMEIIQSGRLRTLCYNRDNGLLAREMDRLAPSAPFRIIGVGTGADSDMRILDTCLAASPGGRPLFRMRLERKGRISTVDYFLFGLHHARNIALAAAVAAETGRPVGDFQLSIESPPGRGRLIPIAEGGFVVDDSYNANPISVTAALRTFGAIMGYSETWVVIGGMKELGEACESEHRKILAQTEGFRRRVFVGREWTEILPPSGRGIWWAPDAERAADLLLTQIRPGDSVMVKGSRAYCLERLVDRLVNRRVR